MEASEVLEVLYSKNYERLIETLDSEILGNLPPELFNLWRILEPYWSVMPASTKYHHAFAGGMAVHTAEMLLYASVSFQGFGDENLHALYKCILIHDLEKIGKYVQEGDAWVYNKDRLDTDDLARAIWLLHTLAPSIEVTEYELNALTHAHGGWTPGGTKGMLPLGYALHICDLFSSQILGK